MGRSWIDSQHPNIPGWICCFEVNLQRWPREPLDIGVRHGGSQNQAGQPIASDLSSAAIAWGLSGGNTSPLTTTTRVPTGITLRHTAHLFGRCNRVLYARLCGHCSLKTIAQKVSKCFVS